MKRVIPSLVTAGLIVSGIATSASVVFAQSATGTKYPAQKLEKPAFAGFGHHRGQRGLHGMPFPLEQKAALLGISSTDLQQRFDQGKTFHTIAQELGITDEQIQTKMKAMHETKQAEMLAEQAATLGITVEDLKTRLASGKKPHEIAKELGWTDEQFQTKMREAHKKRLQALVDSGKLTQEQADKMIQQMDKKPRFNGKPGLKMFKMGKMHSLFGKKQ
jgi:DNA-directed RNA polymerase specialized sigma subunit